MPLGHSAGFAPVPLEKLRAFYARHNQPVRLLIPERIGKPALTLVESGGWSLGEEILVMTHPLTRTDAPSARFRVDDTPDADWLALYHFRGQPLPAEALRAVDAAIEGRMAFARLVVEGRTVAVTRATITESTDGRRWLGYSAVEVAPDLRRRGLGTELVSGLLGWGAAAGADAAYLQTRASNVAAVNLYHATGFVEHHRHRYAQLG